MINSPNISISSAKVTPKLNKTKATLTLGNSITLKMKNTKLKPKWSSSKKSVASVNKSGKVTAKKAGITNITAEIGKDKYTCKITVPKQYISEKTLTLHVNSSKRLKIYGLSKKDKVVWGTDYDYIADVSDNGAVIGKNPGETTVYATVNDDKTYECNVRVISDSYDSDNSYSDDNYDDDYDEPDDYNYSAYDKLYKAIINSGKVNSDGNNLITYTEYNGAGDECKAGIVYNKKSNQFHFICSIKEQDSEESTVIDTFIDRNGSKTIAVNCISIFEFGGEEEFFDMTGYITVANYIVNTDLNFTVNDSKTHSINFCKKQASVYVSLGLLYCESCLLENNVGVTLEDLGFINFYA